MNNIFIFLKHPNNLGLQLRQDPLGYKLKKLVVDRIEGRGDANQRKRLHRYNFICVKIRLNLKGFQAIFDK